MGLVVLMAVLFRIFKLWKLMRRLRRSRKYALANNRFLAYCEECYEDCKNNTKVAWNHSGHYKEEEVKVAHRSNNYQTHKIRVDKIVSRSKSKGLIKRKYYFLVVWEFIYSNNINRFPHTRIIKQKKIMYQEVFSEH